MDKLTVSGINTHMGDSAGGRAGKKYDISGLQGSGINGSAHAELIGRSAGGGPTQCFQP